MSDVTRLFEAVQKGDRQAAADLFPLLDDELRKFAAVRMAAEASGHTLDATALVHEAYLRLIGDQRFDGRGHFVAAASEAVRRILVDHAQMMGVWQPPATAAPGFISQRRRRGLWVKRRDDHG